MRALMWALAFTTLIVLFAMKLGYMGKQMVDQHAASLTPYLNK